MTIELYTWPTPNGHKIHIMLEETGIPYNIVAIDIGAGDQFTADFLKISPNNKMPALIDPKGPENKPISIFESGAILIYLAEKCGRLLPKDQHDRYETLQWLMFQMGGIGPMLGQAHHFRIYAEGKAPYATERYTKEAKRLYGVLERQLNDRDWIAAGQYTIADIAIFPWLRSAENQGVDMRDHPNVARWFAAIMERPAVKRGLNVLADRRRNGPPSQTEIENLFGAAQYESR